MEHLTHLTDDQRRIEMSVGRTAAKQLAENTDLSSSELEDFIAKHAAAYVDAVERTHSHLAEINSQPIPLPRISEKGAVDAFSGLLQAARDNVWGWHITLASSAGEPYDWSPATTERLELKALKMALDAMQQKVKWAELGDDRFRQIYFGLLFRSSIPADEIEAAIRDIANVAANGFEGGPAKMADDLERIIDERNARSNLPAIVAMIQAGRGAAEIISVLRNMPDWQPNIFEAMEGVTGAASTVKH